MTNETKVLIGVGVVTLILVVIAVFSFGGNKGMGNEAAEAKPQDPKLLIQADSYKFYPTTGSESAKVTLVEFGDFQCPACGSAHPVVSQIVSEYQGKLQFIFRNYPLPVHRNAMVAALAAEAAGAQGKFYEMHDLLFENQTQWSESKDPLKEHYLDYAKELKLDVARFEKEVKEQKYKAKVEKDVSDGNAVGVNATPTFFINGIKQVGGMSYDDFKKKIDEELKK